MQKLALVFSLTLSAIATHASAQNGVELSPDLAPSPPASEAFLTVAKLNRMCSPFGMMQYTFGETGVPGSTKAESLLSRGLGMPEAYAPFERAKPMGTAWSNQLFQMTYSFKLADKAQANTVMAKIGAVAEEAGWIKKDKDIGNTPMYQLGGVGELSFEWPEEVEGGDILMLSLDQFAGEVSLTCVRADLAKVQFGEAFGRLPEGTPRPVMPAVDVPPALNLNRCQHDDVRARMRTMLDSEEFMDKFSAKMLARTTYRDRLTTWMIWKLDQSGKIETMEIVGLVMDASGYASPDGNPFAALGKIREMIPIVQKLGDARKADDPFELCVGLMQFQKWIEDVDAITLAQTKAAHKALEAKARELGVSLD